MPQPQILVVDDDPKIRALLRRCLEGDGFAVTEAADTAEFLSAIEKQKPDLITLDLNLGSDSGLDLARDIRRDHHVPIIMVTGKDDVIDRVVGLELGADDYITKPFHVREVLARVHSVLRRVRPEVKNGKAVAGEQNGDSTVLGLDGMMIYPDQMEMSDRDGRPCDLTTADFKLLMAFLGNSKRPLSRDRLMNLIEGPEWVPLDRTIDNQVARLRKKIERDPARPALIKTVRGVGYMLTERPVPGPYPSSKRA